MTGALRPPMLRRTRVFPATARTPGPGMASRSRLSAPGRAGGMLEHEALVSRGLGVPGRHAPARRRRLRLLIVLIGYRAPSFILQVVLGRRSPCSPAAAPLPQPVLSRRSPARRRRARLHIMLFGFVLHNVLCGLVLQRVLDRRSRCPPEAAPLPARRRRLRLPFVLIGFALQPVPGRRAPARRRRLRLFIVFFGFALQPVLGRRPPARRRRFLLHIVLFGFVLHLVLGRLSPARRRRLCLHIVFLAAPRGIPHWASQEKGPSPASFLSALKARAGRRLTAGEMREPSSIAFESSAASPSTSVWDTLDRLLASTRPAPAAAAAATATSPTAPRRAVARESEVQESTTVGALLPAGGPPASARLLAAVQQQRRGHSLAATSLEPRAPPSAQLGGPPQLL